MSPGRKRPDVALSKVPSIGELCNRLGFQRATPAEISVFTDTTHAFRKSYTCTDGSPGSDLVDWYLTSVQRELNIMAEMFLTEGGNGERFWAEGRGWNEDSDITFPEDAKEIRELLKQLFWKQNKYALNNNTYIQRKVIEGRDQSRDNTTPVPDSALRASMASTSTIKPADSKQQQSYDIASRPTSSIFVPRGPIISLLDDDRDQMVEQMQAVLSTGSEPSQTRDIFEFPEDGTNLQRNPTVNEDASYPPSMRTPNKHRQAGQPSSSSGVKKASGISPPSKRPKIADKREEKFKKRKHTSPRRTSARLKTSESVPNYAEREMFDNMLGTDFSDDISTPTANRATDSTGSWVQQSSTKTSPYNVAKESSNGHRRIQTPRYRLNSNNRKERPEVPVAPMFSSPIPDETQPSRTYSLPDTISEPPTPLQRPSDLGSTPDTSTAKPRPKANGLFWIITSPEPNYNEETWKNGQIKGKSLSDVIKEISSITHKDGIEKLKIKLTTPYAQTTTTVQNNADDHWEFIKSNMEEKIREAFARDRERQNHFMIWVEPIYGYSAPVGGTVTSEVEEVDW